jgi:hypothetical protein
MILFRVLLLALVAVAGVLLALSYADIVRYLKIRSM